jgi:hypothetical protein
VASPNANYGQIESSTLQKWLNKNFSDNIFNGLPLFAWMNKNGRKKRVDGGAYAVVPLMYGKNTTNKWMTAYDTVDISGQDGLTAAQFNWKMISGSVAMSRFEKAQNMGASQLIDLWDTKIEQEKISLQDKFNTDLYGDGTTDSNAAITGLAAMITTTGTYGNINRSTSTNSWWRAIIDTTTSVLSENDMRTQYNNQSKNVTHPTIILTTQALYEKYESLLVPARRFVNDSMADLGFDNLTFHGVPIVYDDACTSGTMFFLNDNYLGLYVLGDNDFYWTEIRNPTTQFVDVMLCEWMGQLVTSNSRFQGALQNRTAN